MKRRAVYFLLCLCFCFSSLSLSSSAVDTPSDYSLDGPNFPDFDPKNIPWQEQPDYIQNIAYMGMDLANFGSDATYSSLKVPFIMIRNTVSECSVFVGLNCAMGTHTTSYALRLCANPKFIAANNSYCYSATFDSQTYERKTDWQRRTFTAWGDTGLVTYTAATTLTTVNGAFDFYFYGGNCIKVDSATQVWYGLYESGGNTATFLDNIAEGFQTGRFFYGMDHYNNTYAAYFQPPSASQIEAETQKGIWESIKSIPDMIGEKLKGLFIPEEGFFDTYVSEYQNYFKDRFGLLYELPDAVMDILQQFISYSPAESGYSIHFPEVVMPVLDNGEWYDQTLIEERDITFEFLEQGAFKTLYTMYRSVVWMIFVFALINLIIRKSERVFGGGG